MPRCLCAWLVSQPAGPLPFPTVMLRWDASPLQYLLGGGLDCTDGQMKIFVTRLHEAYLDPRRASYAIATRHQNQKRPPSISHQQSNRQLRRQVSQNTSEGTFGSVTEAHRRGCLDRWHFTVRHAGRLPTVQGARRSAAARYRRQQTGRQAGPRATARANRMASEVFHGQGATERTSE